MAGRVIFRRTVAPAVAGALSAGLLLYPRNVYAEAPESQEIRLIKKPIYDDPHEGASQMQQPSSSDEGNTSNSSAASQGSKSDIGASSKTEESVPQAYSPTPTDRLAAQIRRARLQLYEYSSAAEARVNTALSRALDAESTVASTVASLAPPPTAREPLVPGAAYILVAALAGSIVARNRGILLRAVVPLTFGGIAARAALPVTTGNVAALVWRWEMDHFPEVAAQQGQLAARAEQFLETGWAHAKTIRPLIEEKTDDARKGIEDWVKKGK